jgi:hypothetical protein
LVDSMGHTCDFIVLRSLVMCKLSLKLLLASLLLSLSENK